MTVLQYSRSAVLVLQIFDLIRQGEQIHRVVCGKRPQLIESADFVAFVGRIRNTMAKEENSHGCVLVGAAGFEPTAPLRFNQGALTAELHAYL